MWHIWTRIHTKRADSNTDLSQVIKVVLVVNPLVVGLQAVRLVGDVLDIEAKAVEKFAFKKLPVREQRERAFDSAWGISV